MDRSTFVQGLIFLCISSATGVAAEGRSPGSDIIEKLKAYDTVFLQHATLTTELAQNKSPFGHDKVGYTEKVTVTTNDDTTAYRVERLYYEKPSYPDKKLESYNYDRQGNFIVWRDTHRQGLITGELNANRAERITMLVDPQGEVILQEEGAPSVEFRPPSGVTYAFDYVVPILSSGRGYSNQIFRVKNIVAQSEKAITFTAYGRFDREEGIWEITVDPQEGYLVRSARFSGGDDSPSMLFISTSGTEWFGDLCVAEKASYWMGNPNNIVTTKTQKYEPKADRQMIDDLHRTFAKLSPNTDVMDWRGNPKEPLMYRVGHLPISERETLQALLDTNTNSLPDETNELQTQNTKHHTDISEVPTETNAIASERDINATSPLGTTSAGKTMLLIFVAAGAAVVVMIGIYRCAKKTDKN